MLPKHTIRLERHLDERALLSVKRNLLPRSSRLRGRRPSFVNAAPLWLPGTQLKSVAPEATRAVRGASLADEVDYRRASVVTTIRRGTQGTVDLDVVDAEDYDVAVDIQKMRV